MIILGYTEFSIYYDYTEFSIVYAIVITLVYIMLYT